MLFLEKYNTTGGDMKINRLIQILGISYLFWHILSKSLETYLKSKELFSNKRKMFFSQHNEDIHTGVSPACPDMEMSGVLEVPISYEQKMSS